VTAAIEEYTRGEILAAIMRLISWGGASPKIPKHILDTCRIPNDIVRSCGPENP